MSTTITTTPVRLESLTAPPPTKNTLAREERSRLLRSTRKLGAVLGTTPKVIEPDTTSPAPAARGPGTRTSRARSSRREAQIHHSRSSSQSSEATLAPEPEPGYVFVRGNVRSAPYQVQAVFDNASPSSSRSSSRSASPHPTSGPITRNLKRKQGQDPASLAPMTIMFPIPGSAAGSKQNRSGPSDPTPSKEKAKAKIVAGGEHTSQPLLLRLRTVPVASDDRPINEDDLHSNSLPNPLSPVSSTFNMSVDIVPPSPSLPLPREISSATLSDREKRRKMAKLARTLGENIPPELVFRNAPPSSPSNSSTAGPSNLARHTSLSFSRPVHRPSLTATTFDPLAPFHKPTKFTSSSKFNATASLPPLPVAAVPTPAPSQPQLRRETTPEKVKKSRHRPQSLSLGSSSAFAAATAALLHREREPSRGTTSLDIRPTTQAAKLARNNSARPLASPKPFVELPRVQGRTSEEGPSTEGGLTADFGRRKEREWSGEWNVKDMEDVAKKLRGLKGR